MSTACAQFLTVSQAAAEISRRFATPIPVWKVRRLVDLCGEPVPRVGLYRLISDAALQSIIEMLSAKNGFPWVPCLDQKGQPDATHALSRGPSPDRCQCGDRNPRPTWWGPADDRSP